MSHTPGPWVVDDANPELIAQLVEGVYQYIATTEIGDFCSTKRSSKEEKANARLIAAAPDLLEALHAVEWVPDGWDQQMCPWCFEACPNHAADCMRQTAIAAAEGG